ncbi:tetratricopeptide repeat protein [Spirulina sp. CS-785/01]|uniref:tetratricopeptide repeat protein n=1 Tax=Spirulina sp. CS-785/01 TaxID=3021716 RepID=UPI0023301BC7|nr:tetratricopeptide repeat protein [Spirulina sp. CS-785/01]MDB9313103.1 tetratricopeptide repeat protein [Spirulina sp. CS-785/01]
MQKSLNSNPRSDTMGSSVEVNQDNYKTEVVEKSHQTPVIVDFYATWCGPCQILKPILERLVNEYDCILATIDIDQNSQLASQFQVEGVPDVRIVQHGKMQPGFVGALSEPQLRDFLSHLNLQSGLETQLAEARTAIASGKIKTAKRLFDQLFKKYPNNPLVILDAAKFLIRLNKGTEAIKLLDSLSLNSPEYVSQAQAVKALLDFQQAAANPGNSELDQKYAQACRLTVEERYEAALQLFLAIVKVDRKYKQDGARKAMTAIFALLGNEHPLTRQYQQDLMMTLY